MLGRPRSAALVMVRVTVFTVMAVPIAGEVGLAGFQFSGVACSYGNGGSSKGSDGSCEDDSDVEYGSANPDRGGGGHHVVLVRVGKGSGGVGVANGGHILGTKLTIILGGGDRDDGVGIRMGWVL